MLKEKGSIFNRAHDSENVDLAYLFQSSTVFRSIGH